jgi:hypothetical protein
MSGSLGTCSNVPSGQDADKDCAASAPSSCGTDGFRDGSGGCRLHAAGTPCNSASCSANVATLADTCDGAGTCVDNGTIACSPYVCGPTSCRTSCAVNADCQAGFWCDSAGGVGVCRALGGNGVSCTASAQCQSGNCVDGVCCNASCTGLCQACNVAGSIGACTNVPSNTDPANECAGTAVCNGAGACTGANGSPCVSGANCLSGSCTDGVCCNTACTGLCQACTAARKGTGADGVCGPILAGTVARRAC